MLNEDSSWSSLICDLSGPIIGNYKGFPWRASHGIAVPLPQDSRPANLLPPQTQKGDAVKELTGRVGVSNGRSSRGAITTS